MPSSSTASVDFKLRLDDGSTTVVAVVVLASASDGYGNGDDRKVLPSYDYTLDDGKVVVSRG